MKTITFILVSSVGLLAAPACVGDDAIPPLDFLRQYREALKEMALIRTPLAVEGRLREVLDRKDGGPPIRDTILNIDFATDGPRRKLRTESTSPNDKFLEHVCVVGDGDFSVRRTSKRNPFGIDFLGDIPAKVYVPYLCYTVDSRFSVGRDPLAPFVNSERFKIIRKTIAGCRGQLPCF